MKTKEQIALQKAVSESIKISGAEAVIRCLLAEGVDLIYGYPGGAFMPVYDELYKFQDQLIKVCNGLMCSGVTSTSHAEGPGPNPSGSVFVQKHVCACRSC